MSQLLRVQNFVVSRDGFSAGEASPSIVPFGHADPGVHVLGGRHGKLGPTAPTRAGMWPRRLLHPATSPTTSAPDHGGATVPDRNGDRREDHGGKGWWGEVPPFHTPVFVLTHHLRPSFTLDDTTFLGIDASPTEARPEPRRPLGRQTCARAGSRDREGAPRRRSADAMHVAICHRPGRRNACGPARGPA